MAPLTASERIRLARVHRALQAPTPKEDTTLTLPSALARLILALAVGAAALTLAGRAAAANRPAPALDAAASYVARHDVRVYCEDDADEWTRYLALVGLTPEPGWVVNGFVIFGLPWAYVAPPQCEHLHDLLAGVDVSAREAADALLTLAHEGVHQRGIRDEAWTDCLALELVPELATRYFSVPARVAQRYRTVVRRRVGGRIVRRRVWRTRLVANPYVTAVQVEAGLLHRQRPLAYQGVC